MANIALSYYDSFEKLQLASCHLPNFPPFLSSKKLLTPLIESLVESMDDLKSS